MFSGQIRLWTRVNMCTKGLWDGIRVLTPYGLAFLSSIPAVSTGTIGSHLQTGKLINILGVECFESINYSGPGSGLNLRTHERVCHQSAAKSTFSTVL